MPERFVLLVEGDDDRETVDALGRADLLDALEARKSGGKDALAGLALDHAEAHRAILVLRDLDDHDPDELCDAFDAELLEEASAADLEVTREGRAWEVRRSGGTASRIFLASAGAESSLVAGFTLSQRALDDLLLELVLGSPETVRSLSETDPVDPMLAARKLREVSDLLDGQGIPVRSAKRLLHLFRGITGFRASPAKYAERVIDAAARVDVEALQRVYGPLCESLRALVVEANMCNE